MLKKFLERLRNLLIFNINLHYFQHDSLFLLPMQKKKNSVERSNRNAKGICSENKICYLGYLPAIYTFKKSFKR